MPPRARTPAPFDNHDDVLEPEPTRSPQDLIHEIASLLQNRRDHVTLVQLALVRLSPYCPQYSTQLMAAGVVREAILALARYPEKEVLVQTCFKFLMTLLHNVASPTHTEASSLVIQSGGVEATLGAMRRHACDIAIQRVGYYLLCNYSTSVHGGMRLLRQGGFIEIVQAMIESSSSSDLPLHQAGCGAICHLVHHNVACKDAMEDLNVVSLLVQLIQQYNTNQNAALLLLCACGALAILADKSDCVKTEIVKMNGMPAILRILRHTSSRYGTQLPCSALVVICHLITARNDIKRAFIDARGVTEVKRYMKQHEKGANVISVACVVFAALVMNSSSTIVDTVVRNGVGRVIVAAMTRHGDKHGILFNACTVIGVCAQLCTFEMAAEIRLIPGCIGIIVMSMKRFPKSEQLQEVACAALGHLSFEKLGLEKEVMQSGGLDAIVAATHQFPDNVVLLIALCSTVGNIAKLQDMANEIKSLGIVAAVVVRMNQHQADSHVILMCLEALVAITNAGIDLNDDITEANGFSLLGSLQSSTDSKVAAKATAVLLSMASRNQEMKSGQSTAMCAALQDV